MNKKSASLLLIIAVLILAGIFQYKKIKSQESSMPSLPAAGKIFITDAYAFATAPNANNGGAFMSIENADTVNDRLIGAKSNISKITEIHENIIDPDNGRMMMRKIKALDIPQKGSVTLQPKGYHVMFIGLNAPLKIDNSFPLTLVFEKAGEQNITVKIVAPGINPQSHH